MNESPELELVGVASTDRTTTLSPEAGRWLRSALDESESAPLVPVSDLARSMKRIGASFAGLHTSPPDIVELLLRARRRLFPPARVRALQRWLLDQRAEEGERPDGARALVNDVLEAFGAVDPLGPAASANIVLRHTLEASLDAARGVDLLTKLVRAVADGAWPSTAIDAIEPHLRLLGQVEVRVPPVDLLLPLNALREERQAGRRQPQDSAAPRQLALIDITARPLAGPTRLTRDAREDIADRLDLWTRTASAPDETVALARAMRDHLRGAAGDDSAIDALLHLSVCELPRRCSAAELSRLETVLARHVHDDDSLLAYGDYLARAQRAAEAIRAYRRARAVASGEARHTIDLRIDARRRRLAGGGGPVWGRRPNPAQLTLRF